MSEIKVSKELEFALDSALEMHENDVNEVLQHHERCGWLEEHRSPLNQFGLFEIAQFYIKGYELREEDKTHLQKAKDYLTDWEEVINEHPRNKHENAVEQLKHGYKIIDMWMDSLK